MTQTRFLKITASSEIGPGPRTRMNTRMASHSKCEGYSVH